MRFTRPGARTTPTLPARSTSSGYASPRRARSASGSGGGIGEVFGGHDVAQASRRLLGKRVVDESPRPGLRAGEVFQLRLGAVRRVELDVEVVAVAIEP